MFLVLCTFSEQVESKGLLSEGEERGSKGDRRMEGINGVVKDTRHAESIVQFDSSSVRFSTQGNNHPKEGSSC